MSKRVKQTNQHGQKFETKEQLRDYILARSETAVGKEAMASSVIATKLVAAATFA